MSFELWYLVFDLFRKNRIESDITDGIRDESEK